MTFLGKNGLTPVYKVDVDEGTTGSVEVGEIIIGGGGFELELDCFRDDRPTC